jgi:chaperonin GroES
MKGEVVATGPGKHENGVLIAMNLKAGDVVFFKKPWDEPIKLDGTEYYILSESEVIGIAQ